MLSIICVVELVTFNFDYHLASKTQYTDDNKSILHIEKECGVFGTIYVVSNHYARLKFGCLVFNLTIKLQNINSLFISYLGYTKWIYRSCLYTVIEYYLFMFTKIIYKWLIQLRKSTCYVYIATFNISLHHWFQINIHFLCIQYMILNYNKYSVLWILEGQVPKRRTPQLIVR
jgi:hypothetical protein